MYLSRYPRYKSCDDVYLFSIYELLVFMVIYITFTSLNKIKVRVLSPPYYNFRKSQGEWNIDRGSQMGAWHQDGLSDWLSVVMWLRLREGATKLQIRNCLKEISRRKLNWSQVPDGRLTPRRTLRLIVGRNVTSTSRGRYKITNPQLSKRNFKEKEKLVTGPRWARDTKTDWPTDCRS
jgi:hypothetical protein